MPQYAVALATPLAACLICFLLIIVLRPLLARYALARPNARSSHTVPTPQGGGVAVIAGTISAVIVSAQLFGIANGSLLTIFAATIFIAFVGAVDDLRPIPVLPRLLLQTFVVAAVIFSLPDDFRLFEFIPIWLERVVLLLAGLWFINLVNFMDGIDWITVAEVVPIALALTLFGMFGHLPAGATLIALALGGAMLGFAPFNRPVARLFLGDVGSLPIGLLVGWCLLQLAGKGHFAAALILPFYYLADATITLVRRLVKGESVWTAHRGHFYQRATENGFIVMQIVTEIGILNIVLAGFAAASIFLKSPYAGPLSIVASAGATAFVLHRFSHMRSAT